VKTITFVGQKKMGFHWGKPIFFTSPRALFGFVRFPTKQKALS